MSYNCQASYLWYTAFTKFKVASTATGCPLENLITFFSTCSKEADPNDIGALRSLVIHKIPKDTNGEQIRRFFQDYGASTKVVVNKRIHQAFVTFSIFEVHQVLMAKDELRNRGKCAHFKYPPWSAKMPSNCSRHQLILDGIPPSTSENAIRSLFGRFGVSIKVKVDERMHRALATFSSEESLYRIWSLGPLHFRDATLLTYLPETYKWSKKVTSADTKPNNQLILSGLPPSTRENDIRSLFGRFGASIKVEVNDCMHQALATFSSAEALREIKSSTLRLKGVKLLTLTPGDYERGRRIT